MPAQPRRTVTGASTAPFDGLGQASSAEDDALARKLANRNRNIVLGLMAVVLLGGFAAFAVWFMTRPSGPPAEVVRKTAEAFGSVETDTVASLDSSRTKLSALEAASPPTYVAPVADELVDMSFQLADLRAEDYALQAEFSALEKEHNRADADHSRADWRTVVNSLVDRMKEVRARIEPIQKRELKLNEDQNARLPQAGAARGQLEAPPPELDRAFGIYYAFKGSDRRSLHPDRTRPRCRNDGWADLMTAALADQPRQTERPAQERALGRPERHQAESAAHPRQAGGRPSCNSRCTTSRARAPRPPSSRCSRPDDPRVKLLACEHRAPREASRRVACRRRRPPSRPRRSARALPSTESPCLRPRAPGGHPATHGHGPARR